MSRRSFYIACLLLIGLAALFPLHAQRTASNPLGAQLNVQDAGTCSTTNSFAWQTLPTNAGTTTLNLSGTWTATVTVRESNNGGGTWSTAATLTTTGTTTYNTNGFTDFCADVTAFTSGIVQVSITTGLQQVIPGSSALAGTNGQLLFNNNGVFGGVTSATYTSSTGNLLIQPATSATGVPLNVKQAASGTAVIFQATNSGGNNYLTVTNAGPPTVLVTFGFNSDTYSTLTNCSSSASPAVCGAAASGSVVVAAAATTVQVNTTAVTANSQVQLTFDSSLGTKLSVTCNTTAVQPTVSARTGGTSFTITVPSAPVTNPACFSYTIMN